MFDHTDIKNEGIAVIGLAGRFPGAFNAEQYWDNICNGIESISFFSDEELLESGIPRELLKKENFIKARGVLGNTDRIDARFFGLHAREAALMDPQHRLFLECAWIAFESAGYCPENHKGRVGVFAGSSMNTYMLYSLMPLIQNIESVESLQIAIGNDKDSLTTEVAYRLNLRGPAITVQSSSSTSLTAVHYACQSLLNYESDMALAGGVSIHFPEKSGYIYREGGTTSSDGHCRTFDAKADGFVAGHGAGVVLLKRLEDALEDGDTIWAVVKGSAVNNDGSVKVSYMAPGIAGQSEVFAMAQAVAGISPEDISYIEAHGTGTKVGDPIEIASLKQVFAAATGKLNFCAIGSVKPNIGHLDSAAGIAGFIKTILMLKYKKLPPLINFTEPNPGLDIQNSPFYINTKLRDWDSPYRIAGVNSFGMGGTNAHVIVAEPPIIERQRSSRSACLLLLSAKSETALQKMQDNLALFLEGNQDTLLQDVAYTLHTGRNRFEYRKAMVCHDLPDAIRTLKLNDPGQVFSAVQDSPERLLFLFFPGALTEFKPVSPGIRNDIPFYESVLDICLDGIKPVPGMDIKGIFFGETGQDDLLKKINEKKLTEVVLFIIEYALARVLFDWGFKPRGMIGMGAGEYVAACLAGTLELKDALRLVQDPGRMGSYPLAGGQLVLNEPAIPFLSSLSGDWIKKDEALDSGYWLKMRGPGSLPVMVNELKENPAVILLEAGPGKELCRVPAGNKESEEKAATLLSFLFPEGVYKSDYAALLETAGRLWLAGLDLDTDKFHTGCKGRETACLRIPLPTYPFEYASHWISPSKADNKSNDTGSIQEDKKAPLKDWFYTPVFRNADIVQNPHNRAHAGMYLFFVPGQKQPEAKSLVDRIIVRLLQDNCRVVTATPGSGFSQQSDFNYEIDPSISGDFTALGRDLKERSLMPDVICYCWNLDIRGQNSQAGYLHAGLAFGFYSLLFLVCAFAQDAGQKELLITVISNQTLDPGGTDDVVPEKAAILGVCRTIPREYPRIFCRYVDIDIPAAGSSREEMLVSRLRNELLYDEKVNNVIAYRGDRRMVQAVEPLSLEHGKRNKSLLKAGGIYWILGGLGTVGYTLATSIAQQVKASIVITGNTGLPEKADWDAWISAHGEHDPVSLRIKKIQALSRMDCDVMYVRADMLDPGQMKAGFESIKKKFGVINGIIDAGGTVDGGLFRPIRNITSPDMALHLKTKLCGLSNINEIIKNQPVDFCLVCSSISSLLGGLGLAEYSASSIFVDAFTARQNQSSRTYWFSIDWDAFAETSRNYKEFGTPLLDLAITAQEAGEVILNIFTHHSPRYQYLISTSNLKSRLDAWISGNSSDTQGDDTGKKDAIARSPRPPLQNSYIAPRTNLEKEIARIWAMILGLETVGVSDNFFELGGNSLAGIQLVAEIKKKFDYQISSVDIYESPTISSLIQLLLARGTGVEEETTRVDKGRDRGQKRLERRLKSRVQDDERKEI